jgi:hypothetical protein
MGGQVIPADPVLGRAQAHRTTSSVVRSSPIALGRALTRFVLGVIIAIRGGLETL